MNIKFRNYNCRLHLRRYANNRPALVLNDAETNEPIATASVNLIDEPISLNEIAIKDYSENEGMFKALVGFGLIEPSPARKVRSGWVEIPIAKLTKEGLRFIEENSQ